MQLLEKPSEFQIEDQVGAVPDDGQLVLPLLDPPLLELEPPLLEPKPPLPELELPLLEPKPPLLEVELPLLEPKPLLEPPLLPELLTPELLPELELLLLLPEALPPELLLELEPLLDPVLAASFWSTAAASVVGSNAHGSVCATMGPHPPIPTPATIAAATKQGEADKRIECLPFQCRNRCLWLRLFRGTPSH